MNTVPVGTLMPDTTADRLRIVPGATVVRVRTYRLDGADVTERRLYRTLGVAVCAQTGKDVVVVEALEGADRGCWECYGLSAYAQGFRPVTDSPDASDAPPVEPVPERPPRKVAGVFSHGSGV